MEKIVLKILSEANDVYPDGIIESYFDLKTGEENDSGLGSDTLAQFIGREIVSVLEGESYSASEARERVAASLATAAQELDQVIAHFRGAR